MLQLVFLTLALSSLLEGHAVEVAKLRRLMADSRFVGLVSPCTAGGSTRNTGAEWIRTAFHDAASHNAAAGTGGIDGSIAYEMGYAENGGPAFATTINQFRSLQQEGVSLADMIVLGAITATSACGGPAIPFYAGRIDATAPVGEGSVPLPESSAQNHKDSFARMGFSQEEMISLIACGHTIGGVHRTVNPRITSANVAPFDDTRIVFDNHVAVDYIRDNRSNPLAQPYDPAFPERSSDARTFALDGNATLARYAASQKAMMDDCVSVFSKMFNKAVPAGTQLVGPITPFSVSTTFRATLRNEAFAISPGSSRLFNMVNQWKSFDIGYTNRDGSIGADSNLLFVRAVRTILNGGTIEVKDFSTRSPHIPASTGIGSIFVRLVMNDGTVYKSDDGEESFPIDDTIMIDVGQAYTCTYSGAGNNGASGLNITMAVLGPYNSGDKVEVIYRKNSGGSGSILTDFRRARDAYYSYYGIFVPDVDAIDLSSFGARITRANGAVHIDDRNGIYFTTDTLNACVAGAEIPPVGPRATNGLSRRNVLRNSLCPHRRTMCDFSCVDTLSALEHCGGCSSDGGVGVDCTSLSDGQVGCVNGLCVVEEEEAIGRW